MIIDCISDLHGYKPNLPGGDLLILAGDYTAADKLTQWADFFHWLKKQPYEKKIVVAGNHDNFFESGFPKSQKEADNLKEVIDFLDVDVDFEYLCDSVTEYNGLKIWGSPWTPLFKGVHPKCRAFMLDESKLDSKFSLIPEDLDILITHGPMHHMLDANIDGYACGSRSLKQNIDKTCPRIHIFGHIHEQGNHELRYKKSNTWCINCCYVNEKYQPVNNYVRIEI
jgi:Icc-related predicted phosphoesterase